MAKKLICPNCGYKGTPKKVTKGSIFIELVLWLAFIVPGIIYSLWRLTSRHEACPQCGASNMVPLSSPRGKKLVEMESSQGGTPAKGEQKKCPACAENIKFEAIKCRYCGHEFDPAMIEEEINKRKETILKRKAAYAAQIKEEIPDNSYICGHCGFVIEKNKFEESNLFCPDCGTPLEET